MQTWEPPSLGFAEAVALVLAADRNAGAEIGGQYERLFDPSNARVDWCHSTKCDDTGFSLGAAGVTSSMFYGSFDGSTDGVRAIAHEAGHAVHRQFMSENQRVAAYNNGPKFMFESIAIFNELLLLDHLHRTAPDIQSKTYYLRTFLDDATFQVFGSADETELEEMLHGDIASGQARTAAELDSQTLASLIVWRPRAQIADDMKAYWARDKLYFTDPFYDVTYLFAGLLALDYLAQFERDPLDFERRFVAMQKNGFDETPAILLKRFMAIDVDDADRLVSDATLVIEARTGELQQLYKP